MSYQSFTFFRGTFALRKHRIRVSIGNHHKYTEDKSEQTRYVDKYIVYPNFVDDQFDPKGDKHMINDIALLKLSAPVTLTPHVQVACLPKSLKELSTDTKCYSTGWGRTFGTGHSDTLKQSKFWKLG